MSDIKLTHIDDDGKARMVDVGEKPIQKRKALAEGYIKLQRTTIELIKANKIKKGDVLTVAEIAGIQAAKKTSELIPLCHNLLITKVSVNAMLNHYGVYVTSEVKCQGQTGVEMEALTGVSVALLTIYDMCKAVDTQMEIGEIKLLKKTKK
ncbi:MAG: cyclic pyranopterin monophosphate synthase MoaC [Prolixibacteraceae bacterium]|jgi:cyclic pyranopterin phosphate synthase|nr:cyclic pyranopterin monophosphate synthase MoaC [Prolixibacteraceae bacterium]